MLLFAGTVLSGDAVTFRLYNPVTACIVFPVDIEQVKHIFIALVTDLQGVKPDVSLFDGRHFPLTRGCEVAHLEIGDD